jgi:hypothetical protein
MLASLEKKSQKIFLNLSILRLQSTILKLVNNQNSQPISGQDIKLKNIKNKEIFFNTL